MTRRPTVQVPEAVRTTLLRELTSWAEAECDAAAKKRMQVSRAYEAGMQLKEIAEALGVSTNTAFRWKDEGDAERAARPDPGSSR